MKTPNWRDPGAQCPASPEVWVGDRVVIIVRERLRPSDESQDGLVVLECTETGWKAIDEVYAGYSVYDGDLWTTEKDICECAREAVVR